MSNKGGQTVSEQYPVITAKEVREALAHLPDDAPVKLTVVHHGQEPQVKFALFNIAYVNTPDEKALVVVVASDDYTPAELYGEEETTGAKLARELLAKGRTPMTVEQVAEITGRKPNDIRRAANMPEKPE